MCLRSFTLQISGNENSIAPETTFWTLGAQHFFYYKSTNAGSAFDIRGFKNILIHKIEAVGNVETTPSINSALVQDWSVAIQISGNLQQIGGEITSPNGFNLSQPTFAPLFSLNKFNPSIEFASPIQSPTLFSISGINAQGIAPMNLITLSIGWFITFNVYYTFEGE
jgi:hypothetical protein